VRLERRKPRNLLLSAAYRLNRWLPFIRKRKLDLLLDLEWIAGRLAHENAASLGLHDRANPFLTESIKPTDKVLDIGCGDGSVLATLPAKRRVGIDYDAAKLEQGRKLYPALQLFHADALTFDTSGFDVAILSHVLEHIDDPEGLLKVIEAKRIYVEVPDFEWSLNQRIREIRGRDLIYSDADHVFEFDRAEIESLFAGCGLKIEDSEFRRGVMKYWVTKSARARRA